MRKIPKKNYLILGVMTVVTVLLVFYINAWIKTYKQNELNTSPLTNNVNEVYKNELHLSLSESNQMILYVGYNNSDDVKELERQILKTIKSKNLHDYFIYYDVTKELENNEYLETLKNEFSEVKVSINKAPMLIYVKSGEGVEVVDSNSGLITIEDLKNLVSKYKLGK